MGSATTRFRPLAGLSCINHGMDYGEICSLQQFPSPRGVELHKPRIHSINTPSGLLFPSPRGVELHKPCLHEIFTSYDTNICSFRPLAGLSCINLIVSLPLVVPYAKPFPSPRGVELHKPFPYRQETGGRIMGRVSVPSRG